MAYLIVTKIISDKLVQKLFMPVVFIDFWINWLRTNRPPRTIGVRKNGPNIGVISFGQNGGKDKLNSHISFLK